MDSMSLLFRPLLPLALILMFCFCSCKLKFGKIENKFVVESSTLKNGDTLPKEHVANTFGCQGKNISIPLSWSNSPKDTKSFAVTMYDPDAPTGSGWWHWIVFNIPPNLQKLPKGVDFRSLPDKPLNTPLPLPIESRTDFGKPGYGGACPPKGDGRHRYVLTVWALDTPKLPLDAKASGAMVGFFLNRHQIQKAVLTTYYQR